MNTAIVHIDCATDSIPEVAEALAALPGVSEVYSVAGNVDLIAVVRVRHFEEIADVIAGKISKTPGVLNTPPTRWTRWRTATSSRSSSSSRR